MPEEQILHTDIFIEMRPVNALAIANETPA